MKYVLVGSDKLGQNCDRWSWVVHNQINTCICWYTKRCSAVGFKYRGLYRKTRYPNLLHPSVKSTADKQKIKVDVKVFHVLVCRYAF